MVRSEDMSKQDRQGVRKPSDIEIKYNLGTALSKAEGANSHLEMKLNQLTQNVGQFMADTNTTLAETEEKITQLDSEKANTEDLATVAKSGSYNDLTDKPYIPEGAAVDSQLSETSLNPVQNKVITAELKKKSEFSGSYNDLTDKPTNTFSEEDKAKLDGIEAGANRYTLEAAGDGVLGGVIDIGQTNVTIRDGMITVNDDGHNHVISNVDGLQDALDKKSEFSGSYNDLSDKPTITDAKVEQRRSQISEYRPLLMHFRAGTYGTDEGEATDKVYYNESIAACPLNGEIKATTFVGDLEGKASVSSVNTKSRYAATISVAGWYRIFSSGIKDSGGDTVLFTLSHNYSNLPTESYIFAVSVGFGGNINISQLSGTGGIITKIRVVYKSVDIYYIDFYYNTSQSNSASVFGIGNGTFQVPSAVDTIPDGYSAYEFDTVEGCKSDKDFVGNLTGNADTATKATQDGSGNNIVDTYATKTQLDAKANSSHNHNTHTQKSMSNTDLNTITTAGWYYGYTGMTNAPKQAIAVMEVLVYTTDWVVQRFIVINGDEYIRHWHSGNTWTDWDTYLHKSGGTLTGKLTASADGFATPILTSTSTFTINSTSTIYTDRGDTTSFLFKKGGTEHARFNPDGHFLPGADSTYNMGASDKAWKNVYADTFIGALSGNATSATKATQDGNGNNIVDTYATKSELNNVSGGGQVWVTRTVTLSATSSSILSLGFDDMNFDNAYYMYEYHIRLKDQSNRDVSHFISGCYMPSTTYGSNEASVNVIKNGSASINTGLPTTATVNATQHGVQCTYNLSDSSVGSTVTAIIHGWYKLF